MTAPDTQAPDESPEKRMAGAFERLVQRAPDDLAIRAHALQCAAANRHLSTPHVVLGAAREYEAYLRGDE